MMGLCIDIRVWEFLCKFENFHWEWIWVWFRGGLVFLNVNFEVNCVCECKGLIPCKFFLSFFVLSRKQHLSNYLSNNRSTRISNTRRLHGNRKLLLFRSTRYIPAESQSTNNCKCGGAKTWALAVGLSTTFYQQCVRGEES